MGGPGGGKCRWGRNHTKVGKADYEVGENERGSAIESVGSLLDECCAIFEEGWHVGYGHERHERRAEELSLLVGARTSGEGRLLSR